MSTSTIPSSSSPARSSEGSRFHFLTIVRHQGDALWLENGTWNLQSLPPSFSQSESNSSRDFGRMSRPSRPTVDSVPRTPCLFGPSRTSDQKGHTTSWFSSRLSSAWKVRERVALKQRNSLGGPGLKPEQVAKRYVNARRSRCTIFNFWPGRPDASGFQGQSPWSRLDGAQHPAKICKEL